MAGKRQAARDERRAALVSAAERVFAHKGYHDATVDDITRAAAVAKGTFYLHFGEKREVYHEVIQGFLGHVEDIGRSLAAADGRDFFAVAEVGAAEVMRVFLEHRELARLAYREALGFDAELTALVSGFYRNMAEVLAANVRRGMELGLFRDVDPMLTAYAQMGMVERVLLQLLEDATVLPPPERIVKDMVQLAFAGLLRHAGP
jgi:AcrR family transcriptional regulator